MKPTIKCAFTVYLTIGIAVAMTIAFILIGAYCPTYRTTFRYMPIATGVSWIIAILAVMRSGDKAEVKLPFFWYWRL